MDDITTTTFFFDTSELVYTLPIDVDINPDTIIKDDLCIIGFSISRAELNTYKDLVEALYSRYTKSPFLTGLHIETNTGELLFHIAYLTIQEEEKYIHYIIDSALNEYTYYRKEITDATIEDQKV